MKIPVVVASLVLLLCGCANASSEAGAVVGSALVIPIDSEYGSLAFVGTVEQLDLGNEYEFRPRVRVTFRPDRTPNRTPRADLRGYMLVATNPRTELPSEPVHREVKSISVSLDRGGQSRQLPAFSFRIPKALYDEAEFVGFGVTDGFLLWPMAVPLK